MLPAEDTLDSLQRGSCPPAQGPSLGRPVLLAASSPQHPCWRPPLGVGLRVLLGHPSPDCQPPFQEALGAPPLLRGFLCLILSPELRFVQIVSVALSLHGGPSVGPTLGGGRLPLALAGPQPAPSSYVLVPLRTHVMEGPLPFPAARARSQPLGPRHGLHRGHRARLGTPPGIQTRLPSRPCWTGRSSPTCGRLQGCLSTPC